jgi:hypothetical protein
MGRIQRIQNHQYTLPTVDIRFSTKIQQDSMRFESKVKAQTSQNRTMYNRVVGRGRSVGLTSVYQIPKYGEFGVISKEWSMLTIVYLSFLLQVRYFSPKSYHAKRIRQRSGLRKVDMPNPATLPRKRYSVSFKHSFTPMKTERCGF